MLVSCTVYIRFQHFNASKSLLLINMGSGHFPRANGTLLAHGTSVRMIIDINNLGTG